MRPNRTWCGRRVTRLPAGGRRIRTAGPPVKRDGVFRDHPDRPVAPSPPRESSDILARGTEGSNPSSSSGESATNCSGGGLRWSSACSLPQLTSDSSACAALSNYHVEIAKPCYSMPHQLLRERSKPILRQYRPSYKSSLRFTNHARVSQTLTIFYYDGVFGSYAGYAGELTSRSSEQPRPAMMGRVHRSGG